MAWLDLLTRIRLTSGISVTICAQSWKSATQNHHFLASLECHRRVLLNKQVSQAILRARLASPSFTAVRKKLFIHSSQYIAGDRPKPKRAGERCQQCLGAGSGASARPSVRPTRPEDGRADADGHTLAARRPLLNPPISAARRRRREGRPRPRRPRRSDVRVRSRALCALHP